ncbi:ABC transporter substrate-binding protein [Jiangella asiatica]|nr:extracellular solute-binding protein [Jiangella asiatica]
MTTILTNVRAERLGARRRRTAAAAAAGVALLAAGCGSSGTSETPEQDDGPATLVVWTDTVRKAGFESYQEAHPEVRLDIQEVGNPDDMAAKLQLANRAGEGWPDIMWAGIPELAAALSAEPYDFAADLSDHIPSDVIDNFAPGSMEPCTDGDRIICLRNDIAPSVLWYDQDLMAEFGYEIPTTWQEFEQLGLQIAQEHPGYSVGSAAGPGDLVYFWPSRCPVTQIVDDHTIRTDLGAPTCTRVAEMLDRLIAAGSMSPLNATDPEFVREYGKPGKLVMAYGPIWYGLNVFKDLYGAPEGRFAVAAPLQWEEDGQVWNGNVGGGTYIVSRHSSHLEAAADLVEWMATGPYQEQAETVTFPAYQPHQAGWIQRNTRLFSAAGGDVAAVLDEAVATIWPDYGLVRIPGIGYGTTVAPALGTGRTILETLPEWQQTITQEAQAAGWDVEQGE